MTDIEKFSTATDEEIQADEAKRDEQVTEQIIEVLLRWL